MTNVPLFKKNSIQMINNIEKKNKELQRRTSMDDELVITNKQMDET